MFAAYASNIQPTTPMQFPVPVYGLSGPMVVDDYHLETPYRNPSPPYQSYRQEPYYTPPSLDDKPKMPSISVPPTVNLNLLTPPPNHITTAISPQPFAAIPNTLPTQSVKKEMHMAIAGTDSALAGIDTPIARHVAQLVVWLWYAPRTQNLSPTSTTAAADLAVTQPFDALSVRVSDAFSSFVSHILHLTKVSHSVVLLSLLYIRRMSRIYPPPPMGSEKVTFIIGLMLGNKFLDDNTYTNRTWADLSKIPVETLNKVEHDALSVLRWDLTVKESEFKTWSQVLDQLIYTHQSSYHRTPYHSQYNLSPHGAPETPLTFRPPRARTQSPPEHQTQWMPSAGQIPSPPRQRKRSACDAFNMEAAIAEQHAKSMRVPERRGYVDLPGAPAPNGDRPSSGTASSLNRAASMNRSGLRPISQNSRRGSVPGLAHSPLADVPMSGVQFQNQPIDYNQSALMAPGQGQYQLAPPPPRSMVFYTCAADAHIGQDGHRRKATLHYQAPPSFYPEQQQGQGYQSTNYQISPTAGSNAHYEPISHLAPIPGQYGGSYNIGPPGIPAPADFANAGPPGYQFEQEMQYQQSNNAYAESQYHPSYQSYAPSQPGPIVYGQRRSIGSSDLSQYHHGALPQTRSEWSSPMPGYPSYW